jgi:hypothetical protein
MPNPTPDERRWLEAVENARFGIWDLDPRLETVHYSPQWKMHLGFPRIHAADSTSFWRCRVHPEDVDTMLGALRAHLDGHSASYTMRFRLRSNGSGYRTMLSRGRVVERDGQGQPLRVLGTMVDLTPRPVARAPADMAWEEAGAALDVAMPLLATLSQPGRDAAPPLQPVLEQIGDLLDRALRDTRVPI